MIIVVKIASKNNGRLLKVFEHKRLINHHPVIVVEKWLSLLVLIIATRQTHFVGGYVRIVIKD